MTKREVRKKAFQSIVKENKTHQNLFEELSGSDTGLTREEIADELAKIPSEKRITELKNIRYSFVVIMIFISLLRIFTLIGLSIYVNEFNTTIILIALFISLIIPILGIVAVFTHRVGLYKTTGAFLGYTLFKTFTSNEFIFDTTSVLSLIPVVAGVIIAFYIPFKLKTNYEKIKSKNEHGKTITLYIFEEIEKRTDPELLDA